MEKRELKGLNGEEVTALVRELGEKPYRARQLMSWIYRKGCPDLESFTDLGKALRKELAERFRLNSVSPVRREVSSDGSVKYLFELADAERVESVLVAHPRGPAICVSTQVGCRQGCVFCLSGKKGLRRNLTAGEIVDQVIALRRDIPPKTRWSVVFMGMGEPLDNYANTVKAMRLITDEEAMGISPSRVTLSTVGLVPELKAFAREGLGVNLAVSLSAPDDETRNRLIPANRRYGLSELMDACKAYPVTRWRKLTFEYVVLAGINDSESQATALGELVRGQRCLVNLIPFNPFPGSPYAPPPLKTVLTFQRRLADMGIMSTIRESRGGDIRAACGQLTYGRL